MDKNINSVGKNCIVEEGRGQIYRGAEEERDWEWEQLQAWRS